MDQYGEAETGYLIATLRTWIPTTLNGNSALSIKSVEKAVRILLVHISRYVRLPIYFFGN